MPGRSRSCSRVALVAVVPALALGGVLLSAVPARAEQVAARPAASAPSAAVAPSPAPAASAAPVVDDPARAKVLFDEAVALAQAGDYPTACAKLEQSRAAHDGLGTAFHLAGCWQKMGRTASAYTLFEQVATKAHDLGQAEREQVARERMEALVPKLSRVRIELSNPAPHTEVRRDDTLVPEGDWGKPVAVDRGVHEVRVTAEGKAPWATKIDVNEAATTLVIQVPALVDAPKEAPPVVAVAPVPKAPAHKATTPPPAPRAESGGSRRTVAMIVGGVGVAALGVGLVEGAQYLHSNREAKNLCPSGVNCTADEIDRHDEAVDDARTARTWAYVGVGVGAVALGSATYLFLSAPRSAASAEHQRASTFRVLPLADGRGTWGGALSGSF